jgi:DNA repair ATPase RecN
VPGTCLVHLEDDHKPVGLANKYTYEMDIEIDPMPNIRMVQPATDLMLLPDAEPTFKFHADDEGVDGARFGLRSVYLEFERKQAEDKAVERHRALLQLAPGYEKDLPVIKAPLAIAKDATSDPLKVKAKRVEVTATWRLARQFKIGDELYVEACADDYCDIYGIRQPARSRPIKITIVGKGELAKVIGEKLENVQKNVEEIEKVQKAANDLVKEVEKNPKANEKDIEKLLDAEAATKQILEKVGNPDEGLRNDLAKLQQLLRDNKMQDSEAQQQAGMIKGALELLAQQEEQIEAALQQARKDIANKANKDPKEKGSKDDPKKADPLAKAGKLQNNALDNLHELQKAMQPWASMEKAKAEVRNVLEQQQQLKKELEGLKLKKEELEAAGPDAKPEEKQQLRNDLNAKAEQLTELAQRAEKLKGLIEDMQKNREDKGDKVNADRLKEAAKIADKAEVPKNMRDVAKDLKTTNPKLEEDQAAQKKNVDNLEKMLAALEGKDDAALEALKQKHDKAKQDVEGLAKKIKELEKRLEEANQLKDMEEKLKKKEEIAKQFGELKEDADKLARELARLQETRAAKDLERLGQDLENAGNKIKGGGDPGEEQKAIEKDIKNVKKDMKQFEEELAREQLAKIADRLQGFLEREENAIERSKEFHKRLLAKKNWSNAFKKTIEGDKNAEEGLAKEVRGLKEKIKEAIVFEHVLQRSAGSMDKAADEMKIRKENGLENRQRDPKTQPAWDEDDIETENEFSRNTVRQQTLAAAGLKRVIDSIKEELAKKPPEPKADDGADAGGDEMPPENKGGFKAQDGIPPMAQLKLLQAEQKDVKARTEEFNKRNPDTMKLTDTQKAELRQLQEDQRSLQELFRQITAAVGAKKGDAP